MLRSATRSKYTQRQMRHKCTFSKYTTHIIQRPSEDAEHASHCSHNALSGAVCIRIRELSKISHDLNWPRAEGPTQPSPPDPLSQKGLPTKRTLAPQPDREKAMGMYIQSSNRVIHELNFCYRFPKPNHT